MHSLIHAAFLRRTTAMLLLGLFFVVGAVSYAVIPKEAAPQIDIPIFNINVVYSGISADDSERLLVRPMERRLQGISGLRRMTAQAGEGFATLQLEFDPQADHQQALMDVRDQVDLARPELPAGAEEPVVSEVDLALFPILTVALSGAVGERTLLTLARSLRDRLEPLPGVLEVDIVGAREDLMEVLVDPVAIESYRISYEDLSQAVDRNNALIAAGAFDTGAGRVPVAIPGVVADIEDVLNMAVLVDERTVVTVRDVADVRQTFADPATIARINGEPTLALEIRRATGANIIATVDQVQRIIAEERENWSDTIQVTYLQNQAEDIATQLRDLENAVIAAILLVLLTLILALGLRSAILVAIAIPGSFLAGIMVIHAIGFTLNIVVLFGLILVIGMLVDGALVVAELAERHLAAGANRLDAYRRAAIRMAWPITASTATTLAVFVPLLFWPGTAGQFMRFLPATVIITLTASLLMALVFVPVLGSLGRRPDAGDPRSAEVDEAEDISPTSSVTARYERVLRRLVRWPGRTLAGTVALLIGAFLIYGQLGRGVEFFPSVEPEFAQVQIQTRGNLSIQEADQLVRLVEGRLLDVPEIETVYARTIGTVQARLAANLPEDVIGTIQLDLVDWRLREPATVLLDRLRGQVGEIPGLVIQIRQQEQGPGGGLPVEIEVGSRDPSRIIPVLDQLRGIMADLGGFVDVADDRPLSGVELQLVVNRQEAARYGADVARLGTAVQLLTNGVLLGVYRPDFTDEEVEIRLRYPVDERTAGQLANLRVSTPRGLVPIANFVEFNAVPSTGLITREAGVRVQTLTADVETGTLASDRIAALQQAIAEAELDPAVTVTFRGQAEDQAEAGIFLVGAFLLAVFLMFLILVTQFNSLFQAFLVLSAIIFSTGGVLLGLLLRQEPFGIVMSGIGIVALAGIVVNNNIVLIDTYNDHRARGRSPADAAVLAGTQRLRPVLLTALTTIIGLLPMVLALTVDFIGRDFYVGAPSTQYWVQLSTAIAGGLLLATLVTVLFTPSMLAWQGGWLERRAGRNTTAPRRWGRVGPLRAFTHRTSASSQSRAE